MHFETPVVCKESDWRVRVFSLYLRWCLGLVSLQEGTILSGHEPRHPAEVAFYRFLQEDNLGRSLCQCV